MYTIALFYDIIQNQLSIIICGGMEMDVRVGDKLVMKKNHPCGCNTFDVLRSGMDFKIRCEKCGHEVMVPRVKAEKNIRKILRGDEEIKKM